MTNPAYRRFHPRWHRARIPIFWWLRKLSYTRFIVRELTSVCVAYTAILLLVQVWMVDAGPDRFERFTAWLASPVVTGVHVVVLVGLLFHTLTWLHLAPRALVLRVGRWRVPGAAVLAGHYAAWLAVSGGVLWIVLGR